MLKIEEGDKIRIVDVQKFVSYDPEEIIGTVHEVIAVDRKDNELIRDEDEYWLDNVPSPVQYWTKEEIEKVPELEQEIIRRSDKDEYK